MTGYLRFKPVAAFPVIDSAGARILSALDQMALQMGLILTVTSGSEPMGRLPTDPHARGMAVDVGLAGVPVDLIHALYHALQMKLGGAFTVLCESPVAVPALVDIIYLNPKATGLHLHVQPVKGTQWPN